MRNTGFPGKCNHCGGFGHKLSQCPRLDAELGMRRGGGKGGKGVYATEEADQDSIDEHTFEAICEGHPGSGCTSGHVCYLGDGGEQEAEEDVIYAMDDGGEWRRDRLLVDTAASGSFAKAGAYDHLELQPPGPGEDQRMWTDAQGGEIRSKGASEVQFFTDEGCGKKVKLRRTDQVQKNILAMSETCDQGNIAVFSAAGGAIIKDPGNHLYDWILKMAPGHTPFRRDRNVYSLDMWVKVPKGKGGNSSGRTKGPPQSSSGRTRGPQQGTSTTRATKATHSDMELDALYAVDARLMDEFLDARGSPPAEQGFHRQAQ